MSHVCGLDDIQPYAEAASWSTRWTQFPASSTCGQSSLPVTRWETEFSVSVPLSDHKHYADNMAPLVRPEETGNGTLASGDSAPATAASSSPPPLIRKAVTLLSLGFGPVLALVTYYPLVLAVLEHQQWLYVIFSEHYDVIFGLPSAALLSFMIVVISEARFDSIEIEISNVVKFRGASGPIILWILCFLSVTFAIKLLW